MPAAQKDFTALNAELARVWKPIVEELLATAGSAPPISDPADANERQLVHTAIAFENLVGDPREGPRDAVRVHYDRHGGATDMAT